MSTTISKDFGPIRDDYAFFEQNSTETENGIAAYLPRFREALRRRLLSDHEAVGSSPSLCRVLDFGCGPGTFSSKWLDLLGCPPNRLLLTLVEPQPLYRQQAAVTLAHLSTAPVGVSSGFSAQADQAFDCILANHVFYYVPDLGTALPALVGSLAPGGVFQTAIAGEDNVLIQFWLKAFAMLGQPVPYHTAESVAAVFDRHGIAAVTETVPYRLAFPDTPDNRSRILRFLLGEFYDRLPEPEIRRFFDPFAADGRMTIDTVQTHFVVTA